MAEPEFYGQMSDPPSRHYTVTPHNTNDLPFRPRSLYVGGQGDIAIVDENGVTATYYGVLGMLPFRPLKIKVTGTTATNIVAMY
jgi:hypothetical protein